ncbi:tetratricopeptide repeat protein [Longirhabdus pacifica]|uniref:tetratricopeptide repeat protein n=1 Tax=Longirhabdus pacifica TaxID=2305227 RepID=UPI0010093C6B|nr:hypothetical protein [Longirhabdus pacifica]
MKWMTWIWISVVAIVAVGIWGYWQWTKPYPLPEITDDVTWSDFNLDFQKERDSFQMLEQTTQKDIEPPTLPIKDDIRADAAYAYGVLSGDTTYLLHAVQHNPSHIGYSTALRMQMNAAGEGEQLLEHLQQLDTSLPAVKLQIALVYVDYLQDPSLGTASLGQISFQSIETLNETLEQNPYDWMAHYARGINNLYWPVGLQRIDQSIQDLEFCVAIARAYEHKPTVLWPMAYTTLGDALVKKGEIEQGIQVWEEGLESYPQYEELQQRVKQQDQALELVAATRGMEQFQRPSQDLTDISVIWKTDIKGSGNE